MSDLRIRITDSQFSDFTGLMFKTHFTNSVSDYPVSPKVRAEIMASLRAEDVVETETQPAQEPQPIPEPEPKPVEEHGEEQSTTE